MKDMVDTRDEEFIEIKIKENGTIWVNNAEQCLLRAQYSKQIKIVDERESDKSPFVFASQRAIWAFMMGFSGGLVFGKLFSFLGLNLVLGTFVGMITGAISGYFIGRRMDNKEKSKCK